MNPAEPEDGQRHPDTFDEIVSAWLAEGTVSRWPDDTPPPHPAGTVRTPAGQILAARAAITSAQERTVRPVRAPHAHFGVTVSICLTLLGTGVLLLAVPGILRQSPACALSAGLMLIALGLGWIVLRSWPTETDDGQGDGGQDDGPGRWDDRS